MFKEAMIVFFKEIKCMLRDKKSYLFTLIMAFLCPIILAFSYNMSKDSQSNSEVNIAISENGNSFAKFCKIQECVNVVEASNPKKMLSSGEIDAYFDVGENLDEKALAKQDFEIKISYNEKSKNYNKAKEVAEKCKEVYEHYVKSYDYSSAEELNEYLSSIGSENSGSNKEGEKPSIIGVTLFIYTIALAILLGASSVAPQAVETVAGEKERGTLEPLLSTSVKRMSIVIGKLLGVFAMGMVTALFVAIGSCTAYMFFGIQFPGFSELGIFAMILMIILTVLIVSCIDMSLSVFAKSIKEAQTYGVFTIIPSMIPFYVLVFNIGNITQNSPMNFGIKELSIPFYNIGCAMLESVSGNLNISHIAIVIGWVFVYLLISLFVMDRLFKKESVIFRV